MTTLSYILVHELTFGRFAGGRGLPGGWFIATPYNLCFFKRTLMKKNACRPIQLKFRNKVRLNRLNNRYSVIWWVEELTIFVLCMIDIVLASLRYVFQNYVRNHLLCNSLTSNLSLSPSCVVVRCCPLTILYLLLDLFMNSFTFVSDVAVRFICKSVYFIPKCRNSFTKLCEGVTAFWNKINKMCIKCICVQRSAHKIY